MHVLVTGGAGFIGRQVVRALAAAGHRIRVLDALLPDTHSEEQPPRFPDGVEFVRGDLRSADTTARALRGIDLVSHHAAVVGRGKEMLDAPHHVSCNDLGTANLLAEMARQDVGRLILAGTVAIYGDSNYSCPEHGRMRPPRRSLADLEAGRFQPRCDRCGTELRDFPVTEEDALDPPRNIYAITKLTQEYLSEAWARETGAQATVLRYHNVYGPDIPYQSPYSGVAAVFRSAVARGEAPQLYEDGNPTRDFVHVSDVATATTAVMGLEPTGFRAYNVASGTPHSIGDVARALVAARGGPAPVVTGKFRIGDVRHIVAAPARLMRETTWRPAMDFESGMKEFAHEPMYGGPEG
ncbi:NAD-dependent dehydratase [Amycolatopsis balhimycina DSM 5908]|uniref:NAD-dependent dehydratase n=1 Tax=Amycolatopsis balhimycina DSM 5908 TaxID=1081091 RepID=A0A428WP75_AMYBA|nr:NAD-dependent epimerase/dehydratase family protein [Amycolatopsis balhimycina]RSM44864.1 NAD-dependent dehydratase [Amycolatopsis balhimycina DSM 5908]